LRLYCAVPSGGNHQANQIPTPNAAVANATASRRRPVVLRVVSGDF